jgi:hypothetical protein
MRDLPKVRIGQIAVRWRELSAVEDIEKLGNELKV